MTKKAFALCSAVALLAFITVLAADKHKKHPHMGGHEQMDGTAAVPKEGGQAAFSAISEIVSILEENPDTDWATVNISGLRNHLVHMHLLMLETEASQNVVDGQTIQFNVRGNEQSVKAINNMVPAHASFIELSRNWKIDTNNTESGAIVTITEIDTNTLSRLKALGFYGFMSLDSHHQAHHLQMAQGHAH